MQGSSYIPHLSVLQHSPIPQKQSSTKSLTGSFLFDQQFINESNKNQNNKKIQFDPLIFNSQNYQTIRSGVGVPNINNLLDNSNQVNYEQKNQFLQPNQNLVQDVQLNRLQNEQESKNTNTFQKNMEFLLKKHSHIQDIQNSSEYASSPQALKSKKLYLGNQERLKCIHQKTNDDCNCTSCQVKQLYNKLVKYNDSTNNTPSNIVHNNQKDIPSNYFSQENNFPISPTKKSNYNLQKFSFQNQLAQQKQQQIQLNEKQTNYLSKQLQEDQRQNNQNPNHVIVQENKQSFLKQEQYQIVETNINKDENKFQTKYKNTKIGIEIPPSPSKLNASQKNQIQDQNQQNRQNILSSMYEQNTQLQQLVQEQQTYVQLLYNQMTQYQNLLEINKIPYSQNNIQINENTLLNSTLTQSSKINQIFQSPKTSYKGQSEEFLLKQNANIKQKAEKQQFLNLLNKSIPNKSIVQENSHLNSDKQNNIDINLQTIQLINSDIYLKNSQFNKNISNLSQFNEKLDNNVDKQSNLYSGSNLQNNNQNIDKLNNIERNLKNIKKLNSDIYNEDTEPQFIQENKNNLILEKNLRNSQNRSQSINSNNTITNSFLDKLIINESDMTQKTGSGNQKSTSLSTRQQNSKNIHTEQQKTTKNIPNENQKKNEFFRENLDLKFIDPQSKIIYSNNQTPKHGSKLELEMKQFKQRLLKFLENISQKEVKRKRGINDITKYNSLPQQKIIQNIIRQSNFMTPQNNQHLQHQKEIQQNNYIDPINSQQRQNNLQENAKYFPSINLIIEQTKNRMNSVDKYLKCNY